MSLFEVTKKLHVLLKPIDEPALLIDGGCHRGLFTEEALSVFPSLRVLAYEPEVRTWETASKKHRDNPGVEIINAALGAKAGKADFYCGPNSATNSLLPRPEKEGRPYYPETALLDKGDEVDVVTLDAECDRAGIKTVDILKLDLQGGEKNALEGASALLTSGRVNLIITEVVFVQKYENQPLFWELCGYLAQFGYSFFSMEDVKVGLYNSEEDSMRQQQWNQADAIFLSPKLRKTLDN